MHKIDYQYLRPKKAEALKNWYAETVTVQESPEVWQGEKATILPLRKAPETSLLFGKGGVVDKDGNYVGASTARDSFNHAQLGGVGAFLANQITQRFGIKTRAVELSLPQRCAGHLASLADHDDAFLAGRSAVNLALLGKSGQMVALERKGESTTCRGVDVGLVANKVKDFPKHVITDDGAGIKEEFLHYLLPLIQGEVQQTYKNGMPLYFDASVLPKV